MSPARSIKTDSVVHETLEALKSKYRVNTFNEVLRRELGLVPDATAEDMGAYLPDELKQLLGQAIAIADERSQLESVVYEEPLNEHEHTDGHAVRYLSPNRNEPIAEIVASEQRVVLYYRTLKGDLQKAGYGELISGGDIVYSQTSDGGDVQQTLLDTFARKLDSAIDRWVED